MGKKGKKKNNSRMPVSHGRGGVPNLSSSPEDSATVCHSFDHLHCPRARSLSDLLHPQDLEISSGSPGDIVDVDEKDKQTPGRLTGNMSNALSQVDDGALNHCAKIIALSVY